MESHSYFLAREQRRDSPPTSRSSTSASTSKSDTTSTSPTTPFYNTMATAATIPIPRMPPSHSHSSTSPVYAVPPASASVSALSTSSSSSRHQKDRSPSTGRSPPNLSSYRSHPYARRQSNPQDNSTLKIHLPPPGSGTSFNLSGNDQRSPRDVLPTTEALWRNTSDRPQVHRITSGGSGKGSGFNLPPIHTMTGTGRASPTLPPPMPSLPSSGGGGGGPNPNSGNRNSPRMYPPSINVGISNNPNSRPGFSTLPSYDRSPTGLSPIAATSIYNEQEKERFREYERERERVEARDRDEDRHRRHSHSSRSHHQPSRRLHHSESYHQQQQQQPHHHSAIPPPNHGGYSEAPSPPLRALAPATATTAFPSQYGSYLDAGPGPGPSSLVRSRSQSSGSGLSRPAVTTHSSEEGMEGMTPHQHQQLAMGIGLGAQGQGREAGQTTGQSRRLAHLMSEQKRRESINSGFQALRVALPSSLATDSKAIILRKAVAHITHLENVLRRAGVDWSMSVSVSDLSPPPPSSQPAMAMASDRQRERRHHQNVGEGGYWTDEMVDEGERERERERIKWEE